MVDSITSGFMKSKEDKLLQEQLKLAQRTFNKVDKQVSKSLSIAEKSLDTIKNVKSRKELETQIKRIKDIESLRSDLRKKGKKISSEEAGIVLSTYESFNDIIINNEKVSEALKKQGANLEELDITLPMKSASEKLGSSIGDFFKVNAEKISSSGLGAELGTTAVRAISPELAFATEALGINLGSMFSFGGNEPTEQEAELGILKESLDNIGELTTKEQEKSRSVQKDSTEEIVKAIQTSKEVVVQSANIRNEETITVRQDNHNELIEINDDIRDDQRRGMLNRFLGKGSLLSKAISALFPPLKSLGNLLGKSGPLLMALKGRAGKAALGAGKAGLVGVAGVVGFAVGDFIQKNLLSEDFKIAIGDFIGPPIDAVISFFKTVPEMLSTGFEAASTLFKDGLSAVSSFIQNPVEALKSSFDWVYSTVSEGVKWVGDRLISLSTFISPFFENPIASLKSAFSTVYSSIYGAVEFIGNKVIGLGTSIFDFVSSIPTAISSKLEGIGDFITDALSSVKESVLDVVTSSLESIKNIPALIKDKVTGFFSTEEKPTENIVKETSSGLFSRAKSFFGFGEQEVLSTVTPTADIKIDNALKTANELEASNAQAMIANSISNTSEVQNRTQKESNKELIKVITESKATEKANSSYTGRRSLDNSPVVSDDIGLIMVLGGGL